MIPKVKMDNKIRVSSPPDANKFHLARIKYLKQKYRNDARPVKIENTKIMVRINLNRIDVSRLFSKNEQKKCTKSILFGWRNLRPFPTPDS